MPKKITLSAQSVAESVLSSWELYWIAEDGTDLGQLTFDRNAFDFIWSPDGRQIAFNSSSSVEGQRIEAAYLIDEDGSNLRTLLPGIIRRVSSWSKTSKLIAFLGYQDWFSEPGGGLYRPEANEIVLLWEYKQAQGLYVMDANGANRRLLFPSQLLVHADWSPDSQHIALTVYARTHLGEAENSDSLHLVEGDGSNPRLVFHSKTFLGLHAWSPDSRRIAFSVPPEDIGEPHSLYIADIDASPPRRLSDIGIDGLFVWSPDSQKIAFIDRTDQQTFQTLHLEYPLSVIDLGSQNVRNLVAGTIRGGVVHPHSPTWSPDSKQIAYASNAEDSWNIYAVDMEAVRTLGLMEVEEEVDNFYIANVAWQP